MTQNSSNPADPNRKPVRPDRPDGLPPEDAAPVAPPKKKKRWILKIALGLVVLVVLLVLLAPTIIGTGIVRGIVVNQINSSVLNGKLAIKDWSFGWTSGVHVEGVELVDANNAHLLSVADIDVPISLLKAATGNIDLGQVTIKGVDFNAQIDSQGQLNFLKAIKPSNTPPSNQPSKLPNVKGTIQIQNVTGTFQDDVHKVAAGLPQDAPLNVTVTIKDINQPIEESVDLGLQVDEKNFVKVKVTGTVSAIQNNLVDIDHLAATQTIELSEGDLAPVTQVLHAMHLNLDVTGKLNGKIVATINTLDNISADIGINLADLSAGGKQLAGDTVALSTCQVGVKASVVSTGGKNAQIKLDLPITLQPKGATETNHVTIHADVPQDSLMGMANVFQAIAAKLAKAPAPGTVQTVAIAGAGNIKIDADLNVANLVGQVPDLLHLEKGTSLTSGTLTHETTITLANGQAVIATDTQLKNFAGTTNGTPVHVNDIDATAGLTAVGGDHPDLHDIKVGLSSAFANVKGGGATLGKMSFSGTSDLKNLQQQISQVVDLDALMHAPAGSHVSQAGTLAFNAHTDGDLTADESDIIVGADFSALGVNIAVPGQRTIDEPKFTASISATLHHTASQFVEEARDLKISAQSPAINFAAGGDVKVGGRFGVLIPSFKITQGTIDLRLAQEEFGGALSMFVPKPAEGQQPTLVQRVADNSVKVASGSVNISGELQFDQTGLGFPQPMQIQIQPTDLTLVDDLGTAQTVHVPAVLIAVSGNGSVSDQNVATIKNLMITTTVGTAGSPLFDMGISTDATLSLATGTSASASSPVKNARVELTKLNGDLPGLQSAMGPLLPLVMPAPPAAQGQTAQPSVIQLLATNVLACTSGKLSGSMLLTCDGTTMTIQKPLTISIADLTLQQRSGGGNSTPINDQTIQVVVGGTVSTADQGIHAILQQLQLQVGDGLKVQGDSQSPLDLAMNKSGAISASGSVQLVNADLPKLLNMAGLILPPDQMNSLRQLTSGLVTGTIKLDHATDANKVSADISVTSLTVGNVVTNETAHVLANATLAADMSAIYDVTLGVDTSFAKKLSISDGQIVLMRRQGGQLVPVGLFDKLQSINVEADDIDLAKVDAIVNVLFNQAATPAPGGTAVVVVPAPQVTAGTATFKMDVSRKGNTTTANISQAIVHGLAIKSGSNTTAWPSDINAQLSAAVQTREDATGQMPMMDQLVQASVTSLSLDSGIGTTVGLADNKSIIATNLSDPASMAVDGGITIHGDIAPAARIAETFGGAKPNAYPYQGHFDLNESLSKVSSEPRLQLTGGGSIQKFVVMGQPGTNGATAAPVFSEDNITIKNPLQFDFKTFSLIIDKADPVAITLNSTGAAGISLSGTIDDLALKRQIRDDNPILVLLTYDLAKLWPIVKPMLSPSQQQTFADLTISGKETRTIKVSGSYPADKPFAQAVVMLQAGGYVTVDNLSTQGITLANFDIPFVLRGGVLRTVYPDQPESSNAPHPATCNGGTLDIGVMRVELKSDPMLLSMPRVNGGTPQSILKNVSINPAMSKSVLGKVLNNPAFVNAKQAQGLISVTINHLDKMPLSALLTQSSPQNQGTADVVYSATGLQLGSPLLAVFGNDNVAADINNATVKFAAGKVTEDTTMMIDRNKPLRFAGVVILETEQFAPMTVYIPPSLFGRLIPAQYQQFVPDQVIVPMKGDMSNPKIQLDQAIAQTIKEGSKKAIINGLLQGLQHIH